LVHSSTLKKEEYVPPQFCDLSELNDITTQRTTISLHSPHCENLKSHKNIKQKKKTVELKLYHIVASRVLTTHNTTQHNTT
jgi:hypothetical protein